MQERIQLWEGDVPLFDESIGQERPTIKPFFAGEKGRGAVVVCPGGGYVMKAAHEGDPVAQFINRCGVNAFVLDYRVRPYQHPAMLLDAQRAIRLVRHNAAQWDVNPNRIGILGFSAGGHLTTMAATHFDLGDPAAKDPIDRVSCRPDAFIPCYAVAGFHRFRHTGSMQAMTGKENLTPEEARFFSAEYNITEDTPPAFLWHTAEDASVPVENSLNLAQALTDKGIPYALHVFPYGRHGIGLGEDNELAKDWPELLNRWLVSEGF